LSILAGTGHLINRCNEPDWYRIPNGLMLLEYQFGNQMVKTRWQLSGSTPFENQFRI
jgi:hypothetical protein